MITLKLLTLSKTMFLLDIVEVKALVIVKPKGIGTLYKAKSRDLESQDG